MMMVADSIPADPRRSWIRPLPEAWSCTGRGASAWTIRCTARGHLLQKCTVSEAGIGRERGLADNMINIFEVNETNKMIEQEKLDVQYDYPGHQPSGLQRQLI